MKQLSDVSIELGKAVYEAAGAAGARSTGGEGGEGGDDGDDVIDAEYEVKDDK